jgi:hypothetical protein
LVNAINQANIVFEKSGKKQTDGDNIDGGVEESEQTT